MNKEDTEYFPKSLREVGTTTFFHKYFAAPSQQTVWSWRPCAAASHGPQFDFYESGKNLSPSGRKINKLTTFVFDFCAAPSTTVMDKTRFLDILSLLSSNKHTDAAEADSSIATQPATWWECRARPHLPKFRSAPSSERNWPF